MAESFYPDRIFPLQMRINSSNVSPDAELAGDGINQQPLQAAEQLSYQLLEEDEKWYQSSQEEVAELKWNFMQGRRSLEEGGTREGDRCPPESST